MSTSPTRSNTPSIASSFLASSITSTASHFLKRLYSDASGASSPYSQGGGSTPSSTPGTHTPPLYQQQQQQQQQHQPQQDQFQDQYQNQHQMSFVNSHSHLYQPPPTRTLSPFQPPPLHPLHLSTSSDSLYPSSSLASVTATSAPQPQQLLTRALAEEIRLLIPPRLQLAGRWTLAYGLERDGVSLTTLYEKCALQDGAGYVLIVRDGDGGLFGAYLTDPPRPSPHYYGTGECFLWRASLLPSTPSLLSLLPPPPSANTEGLRGRSTTLSASGSTACQLGSRSSDGKGGKAELGDGASTPRIRFKAFPYSGINDYMIFCQTGFLSVGGGYLSLSFFLSLFLLAPVCTCQSTGISSPKPRRIASTFVQGVPSHSASHSTSPYYESSMHRERTSVEEENQSDNRNSDGRYGLWLDSALEKGVSSACPTFGNESLSDEGDKFDVLGVEIWAVGS
ncbi:MAG: hypothetical protein M1825_004210 [Sarcosagium campestre]|nr:MAG: hypothetical protein M1825_004210 [Sarcosagium campestre]